MAWRATAESGRPRRARSRPIAFERRGTVQVGLFEAMASPCEVLVDGASGREARRLAELAAIEAWRLERAFSRYRDDNVVHRINASEGRPVDVDAETARLLDFADRCHALSGGLFDVTSGVLRRAWSRDGAPRVPEADEVAPLLALVGWQRATWAPPRLTLPAGMQIDFGGIGKEYAVDRVVAMLAGRTAHTGARQLRGGPARERAARERRLAGRPRVGRGDRRRPVASRGGRHDRAPARGDGDER